ncbi:MAG: hypothetical protein AAF514_02975 [Verrucomicrobiota bacterium]
MPDSPRVTGDAVAGEQAELSVVPSTTVVTLVDEAYYWGAYLLAASIRKSAIPCHVAIRTRGELPPDLVEGLAQFDEVSVRPLKDDNPRSLNLLKAQGMLQALEEIGGDFLTWIDADCLLIGDTWDRFLHPFVPANGEMYIRQRQVPENLSIYQRFYQAGDTRGSIPQAILKQWKKDVGERDVPRFRTKFVTNVLSLHRRHEVFIRAWADLIDRVVPEGYQGTLNFDSPAYHITDESALNALLFFRKEVPAVADYPLNKDLDCYLAHFVDSPKPWNGWAFRNRHERAPVYDLIDWIQEEGWVVPGVLPSTLDRSRATRHLLQTWTDGAYWLGRRRSGQLWHSFNRFRN